MFDIREELPAEPVAEPVTKSLQPTVEERPKQQMRYLIKKGGKQTVSESPSFSCRVFDALLTQPCPLRTTQRACHRTCTSPFGTTQSPFSSSTNCSIVGSSG